MSCALCQSGSPLQDSHVIREFLYTRLYDAIHRFHLIPTNPMEREQLRQKGLREKLLCRRCEEKFSRWEKYAKEAFVEAIGIRLEREGDLLRISNLDYRAFRLFLLSLLWRMGVSKLEFFKDVDLGSKHGEILRLALLNEDALDPLQYPCVMYAVHLKGKCYTDWISPPIPAKSESQRCYCIVINGILFRFFVASHAPPADFARACISRKGEMRILISELREIPLVAEFVDQLGSSVRACRRLGMSEA